MNLLIGGPGTGKTTTLVQKIIDEKPNSFALLTFTRQAAQEAKNKLLKVGYNERDLEWVRTIHSLAFKCLKLNRGCMFDWNHQINFGKEYGFEFSNKYRDEEDGTYEGLTADDIIFRQMTINETTNNHPLSIEIDISSVRYMSSKYVEYKNENKLLDFNDLLKNCLKINLPRFDLLLIDEAQDLSPLQFIVIGEMVKNCNQVIYAGDDDQMIYEWAGVNRDNFMQIHKYSKNIEILDKNWRLPEEIISSSEKIIQKCTDRIYKPMLVDKCSCSIKSIKHIFEHDILDIGFNSSLSYLILTRNSFYLNDIKWMLNDANINWQYLQGYHNNNKSNIKISTIHGSKGAEADVVILFTDVTNTTYENITSNAEHRVWYVGMTRARKELWIIEPRSSIHYDI